MNSNNLEILETKSTQEINNFVKYRSNFLVVLLSVSLFLSISINIYYVYLTQYSKNSISESQKNVEPSATSLKEKPATQSAALTSTPLSMHAVDSRIQKVTIETQKYLDSPGEKEFYEVTFEKVSSESAYALSDTSFQRLIIADKDYELTLSFPQEGQSYIFEELPPVKKISSSQFGNIFRIVTPNFKIEDYQEGTTHLAYASDFSEDCSQHLPKPAACSFLQVTFPNPMNVFGKTNVHASCDAHTSEAIALCDKLVSSLQIEQLQTID